MILELLKLFWIFFKIGAFTFGGGYAMIPMFRSYLVPEYITNEMLTNFIGVSESTPGPFAVNMATFIGMEHGGLLSAAFSTLGVVLPSYIIILVIASLGAKFLESPVVHNAFKGLKPVVIGLIISVAFGLIIQDIFPNVNLVDKFLTVNWFSGNPFKISTTSFNFSKFDYIGPIIMVIAFLLTRIYKKLSPIILIIISAILGLILYGFIPNNII